MSRDNSTSAPFPRCSSVKKTRPSGIALLCSEPFRLFFPLGLFISLGGVSLWPAYYAKWIDFHPGIAHARLMTIGFLGAFVFGFTGTAMPRMLSAPKLKSVELGALALLTVALSSFYLTGRVHQGDITFVVLSALFILTMGVRWLFLREDHPPPPFIFAFAGIIAACAGGVILVTSAYRFPGMEIYRLGQLFCYQAFLLFPVLGVAAFLTPRILFEEAEKGKHPPVPWIYPVAGTALIASLVVEAWGHMRVACLIRLVTVAAFLHLTTAVFRRTRTPGTLAVSLRIAVFSILAGLFSGAVFPQWKIGMEHIAFVSGFGLLALTIAARVSIGHAGEGALFFQKMRPLKWIAGLLLVAMSTRAVADVIPKIMVSHHIYAAILWVAAALIWLRWLSPMWRKTDPDDG